MVLAGYSQGAMVVHRNLHALEASPNLAAVLLVADGDRLPEDPTLNLGTASGIPERGKGVAQDWPILAHAPAPLPPAIGARTISVCDLGDAVCDYDPDAEDSSVAYARRRGHPHQLRQDHRPGLDCAAVLPARRARGAGARGAAEVRSRSFRSARAADAVAARAIQQHHRTGGQQERRKHAEDDVDRGCRRLPPRSSISSTVPDTATPTPASVTNAVSVTPAASPARSGRTTAWVATVVNAYTNPNVNPHAVSAGR